MRKFFAKFSKKRDSCPPLDQSPTHTLPSSEVGGSVIDDAICDTSPPTVTLSDHIWKTEEQMHAVKSELEAHTDDATTTTAYYADIAPADLMTYLNALEAYKTTLEAIGKLDDELIDKYRAEESLSSQHYHRMAEARKILADQPAATGLPGSSSTQDTNEGFGTLHLDIKTMRGQLLQARIAAGERRQFDSDRVDELRATFEETAHALDALERSFESTSESFGSHLKKRRESGLRPCIMVVRNQGELLSAQCNLRA